MILYFHSFLINSRLRTSNRKALNLLKTVEVDPKYSTPVEVRREKIEELRKTFESLKEV